MSPAFGFLNEKKSALLFVDVQKDYLRNKIHPPAHQFIKKLSALLKICREYNLPVIHSQTLVKPDGSNRMPHQKVLDLWRCVEGTTGSRPPEELLPLENERVLSKTYYSAFSNPELHSCLQEINIDHLIIAGLYTHACVRATVLDAYELGYKVTVPEDGVGSKDLLHAELSKSWMASRACTIVPLLEILNDLREEFEKEVHSGKSTTSRRLEVSYETGSWKESVRDRYWEHHNPSKWKEVLKRVPIGDQKDVDRVVTSSVDAQVNWGKTQRTERLEMLVRFIDQLENRKDEFISNLALEVGKPRKAGHEEFKYGLNLMRETIRRAGDESDETLHSGIRVRYCSLGTVALITPWNNPFAIPLGKILPALVYGNSVVWKPALQTSHTVSLIIDAWESAKVSDPCLNVIFGDATTAQNLALHSGIQAISFTGSIRGGRDLSMISASRGIRLQAEAGGNNAVIVGRSADASQIGRDLCPAVYSFSGQRCTAPRRLIIAKEIFEEFTDAFVERMNDLKIGYPDSHDIDIGPVISKNKQEDLKDLIEESRNEGAKVIRGGYLPKEFEEGCWFAPTLITDTKPTFRIFQEESFGPIAVLVKADDFDEAIKLCNAVPHGLSATLYSRHENEIHSFLHKAKAGILRINSKQAFFAPDAPFNGWKASGRGVAERGRWDREFYTRVQTIYHKD